MTSCTSTPKPILSESAKIQYRSATSVDLMNLPKPKSKIVVALYEFKDKTGQYKSSETGGSNSRAVTQGASVMVLQALEDSGWFLPIEREGLSNLLKERQIMDLSNQKVIKTAENPLIYSDIILEGGIISYESNIVTGGAGARFLGTGISNQFREDRVTVYLRAVSPKSGRILKTVSTSKTIISNKVDVGLYQYLSPNSILEFEAGYSSNEPPQVCVQEAIEKAVLSLIIEGAIDNLWEFNNETDINNSVVLKYNKEKIESQYRAPEESVNKQNQLSFSCRGIASYIFSDYRESDMTLGLNGEISIVLNPYLSLFSSIEKGEFGSFDGVNKEYLSLSGGIKLIPLINTSALPSLSIAMGGIYFNYNKTGLWKPIIQTSLGLDIPVLKNTTISPLITYTYPFSDLLDDVRSGDLNDSYLGIKLGLTYFLEYKK